MRYLAAGVVLLVLGQTVVLFVSAIVHREARAQLDFDMIGGDVYDQLNFALTLDADNPETHRLLAQAADDRQIALNHWRSLAAGEPAVAEHWTGLFVAKALLAEFDDFRLNASMAHQQ